MREELALANRTGVEGQHQRGLNGIDLFHRQSLAFDPAVDGPEPGILATRAALSDRNWDFYREQRSQPRQPVSPAHANCARKV